MKKIIFLIFAVLLLLAFGYILPSIAGFVVWLFKIDNTDFGFPIWLDWIISGIAGIIAYAAVGFLSNLIGCYDKSAMSSTNKVIGIIVGFAIGLLVHTVMQYWYFILGGLCLLLAVLVAIWIVVKRKDA